MAPRNLDSPDDVRTVRPSPSAQAETATLRQENLRLVRAIAEHREAIYGHTFLSEYEGFESADYADLSTINATLWAAIGLDEETP